MENSGEQAIQRVYDRLHMYFEFHNLQHKYLYCYKAHSIINQITLKLLITECLSLQLFLITKFK